MLSCRGSDWVHEVYCLGKRRPCRFAEALEALATVMGTYLYAYAWTDDRAGRGWELLDSDSKLMFIYPL
jgi:hypothetical protein